MQRASLVLLPLSTFDPAVQATTSVSFYNIAPGLDVTLFGILPDVASAAKVSCVLSSIPIVSSLVPSTVM